MGTVDRTVHVTAPVQRVFDYVSDTTHMPEWFTNFTEVKVLRPGGVGRAYAYTFKMMGVPLHGEVEIVEEVPGRSMRAHSGGAVDSDWRWRFEPEGEGTRLSLTVEYLVKVPLFGRLAERMLAGQNERDADAALAQLKRILEGPQAAR